MGAREYDVLVVGGGASGLLAAGAAAEAGASVLLLERMLRLGSKLRITGKGRCNITNLRPLTEYGEVMYGAVDLLEEAFRQFSNHDTVRLLENEGVSTVLERGVRVYTASGRAQDVVDALAARCARFGVEVRCGVDVVGIHRAEGRWRVEAQEGDLVRSFTAYALVLACGGCSYPRTGSDGSGYELARSVGHSVTEIFPSLVGFRTIPRLVAGRRLGLRNVGVEVRLGSEVLAEDFGEVELTFEGVGGSAILRVSRVTMEAFRKGLVPQITLDLKPALSPEQLVARIRRDAENRRSENLFSLCRAWVPRELVPVVLRFAAVSSNMRAANLSDEEIVRLAATLKAIRLRVVGHEDWHRAVVTAGGIVGGEVESLTLRSRIVDNLYICGELLDVDANTGGYNLQIAFSTGFLAGRSAARAVVGKGIHFSNS